MKKSLSIEPKNIPSEEEFTKEFIMVLIKGINYENAISEEAKKQFTEILKLSEQTIIWTEGEGLGTDEYHGSREQLHKIANTNFFTGIRNQIAKEKNIANKLDVLSIYVSENKMKLIPDIVESLKEKQIDRIILFEDRLKNIMKFMKESDIDVFPVWVRQSIHKDNKIEEGKTIEQQKRDFHAIDDISEISNLLAKNNVFENSKVAAVFDFDGVLMNDDMRRDLQVSAVIKRFKEFGWL